VLEDPREKVLNVNFLRAGSKVMKPGRLDVIVTEATIELGY
jgi:hypothetical protein